MLKHLLFLGMITLIAAPACTPKKGETNPADGAEAEKTPVKSKRQLKMEAKQRVRMAKRLRESADGFYTHLIWERYTKASEFIAPDQRGDFMREAKKKKLKITEFDIVESKLLEDTTAKGEVRVAVKAVRQADLVLVTEDHYADWLRDKKGHWYLQYPYRAEESEN